MTTPTYTSTIYIAGDLNKIKDVCRRYCLIGLCVSVTPTDFIFTGGCETGAAIGLINYPRFPSTTTVIDEAARELAAMLLKECCQRSCTIVNPNTTEYIQNDEITIPR